MPDDMYDIIKQLKKVNLLLERNAETLERIAAAVEQSDSEIEKLSFTIQPDSDVSESEILRILRKLWRMQCTQ
jgi:hypothetical protein